MNLETYTTVAFSTGHITEDDRLTLERIAEAKEEYGMITARSTGFFIKLMSEDNDIDDNFKLYSTALQNIIKLSEKNNFSMIEIDCDGKIYEELPTFDW